MPSTQNQLLSSIGASIAVLVAGLTATESGMIPTPSGNEIRALEIRIQAAESKLSQSRTRDEDLEDAINQVDEHVEDTRETVHKIETSQARIDQKLEDLKADVSEDFDDLQARISSDLMRIYNKIDAQTSSPRPRARP